MKNTILSFLTAIFLFSICSFKPAPAKITKDTSKQQTIVLVFDSKVKSTVDLGDDFYKKLNTTKTDSNLNMTLSIMSKYFSTSVINTLSYFEQNYLPQKKIIQSIKKHNTFDLISDCIMLIVLSIFICLIYRNSKHHHWEGTLGLSILVSLFIMILYFLIPKLLDHFMNQDFQLIIHVLNKESG